MLRACTTCFREKLFKTPFVIHASLAIRNSNSHRLQSGTPSKAVESENSKRIIHYLGIEDQVELKSAIFQ